MSLRAFLAATAPSASLSSAASADAQFRVVYDIKL